MVLGELYQASQTNGPEGERARQLLHQTHWFTVNSEFDPRTGDALPQALSVFLAKIARYTEPKPHDRVQDRLYRITEHVRPAVERLLRSINESPRREHAMLPIRAVRELDAGSFIKLSMRPGRNIREKLAGNPYLQAVRRFQSVDLPENRLLKAFVSRLSELLELRCDILGEPEDQLLPHIRSWLLSDNAKAIGRWENPPPNNTLLAHRDYRRVWDAWRRLQTLDDDIALDFSRLNVHRETIRQWTEYGRMYREGTHLFADMPVLFDYEDFTIRTWSREIIFQRTERRINRSSEHRTIKTAACVDLAELHPRFASLDGGSWQRLAETYLWQQWKNDAETIDITLFNSDVVHLHQDATTIASPDLFFARDSIPDHLLDRAARTFANRLRETFKNEKLFWLVPDALNDFDLEIIRRNLNARFPGAEPLPRSVAAVFERIDYNRITSDGYQVVVVDTFGSTTCATKLIARFDADLKRILPDTNGYYWERCPPVILFQHDARQEQRYNMVTVDSQGAWHHSAPPERPQLIDPDVLKDDKRIGQFVHCINVSHSPVAGGIRLHTLQVRAGDIPLWRDQIPELYIKTYIDGYWRRFCLVARGTTIKPIRGLSVQIPIKERFTLPAGRHFYQFPLFQGENAAELRFSARLDSPAFPLKSDTACELLLTFQYGDDEPYTLTFVPLDKSLPPIRATWQHTVEEIITDAPSPSYPNPLSWDDLRKVPKPDSNETSDLLQWVVAAVDGLHRDLFVRPRKRTIGQITAPWREDKNGKHFTFAQCSDANVDVFVHEDEFVNEASYEDFECGDYVSFELQEREGRFNARKVAAPDYAEAERLRMLDDAGIAQVVRNIRKRIYFPIIQVWRDGRSIGDKRCPEEFTKTAAKRIEYLAHLARLSDIPLPVKNEIMFLLACLHKDTVDECIDWITEQAESDSIHNPRAVGFALGDVSQRWQKYIFAILASSPRSDTVRVFAYAIWREQHLIERFSLSELKALLNALLQRLANIHPPRLGNDRRLDKRARGNWARATAEPLELLLGLLRTRASNNPDIRMLLQPHQRITKQFAEQVDRIEEVLAETHVTLFSRVQINMQKPEGLRTPNLLYALRLYLTGDDGANAIHITGISDTDDD
jgi:cold shock CspA family protein